MGVEPSHAARAIFGGAACASAILASATTALNAPYGLALIPMTFAVWFCLSFASALLAAGTLGLAWHHFAKQRRWHSAHVYWGPSALCGAVIAFATISGPAILAGNWSGSYFPVITAFTVGYGLFLGGLTGLFAWLIRRPDRDAPANPPTSPA